MSTDVTGPVAAPRTERAAGPARRLRRWSIAALLANAGIVVTGGIVRVTASGLGCPTWPTCEDGQVLPTAVGEQGWRQLVEFGNRTLTGVVLVTVIGALFAARAASPPGDPRRRLAGALVVGVLAQAVLGGITVLLDLSPLVVASHFLLSMVLIAIATVLVTRSRADGRPGEDHRARGAGAGPGAGSRDAVTARLGLLLGGLGAFVLVLGTVVTATGPHAGDPGTPRLDLPLVWVARTHSTAVWLTVLVTVALLVHARRRGLLGSGTARWAGLLLALEVAQGAVGYWQYLTAVPPRLVILHMALACAFWIVCVRTVVAAVEAAPSRPAPVTVGA